MILDGHTGPDALEHSETFAALKKLLGIKSNTPTREEHGCRIFCGERRGFTVYVKGNDLTRGKFYSHELYFRILNFEIEKKALASHPNILLMLDADSGVSPGGLHMLYDRLINDPDVHGIGPKEVCHILLSVWLLLLRALHAFAAACECIHLQLDNPRSAMGISC